MDIEQIADAVGHINSTVTKAVYRHQIADEVTLGGDRDGLDFRRGERLLRIIGSAGWLP